MYVVRKNVYMLVMFSNDNKNILNNTIQMPILWTNHFRVDESKAPNN